MYDHDEIAVVASEFCDNFVRFCERHPSRGKSKLIGGERWYLKDISIVSLYHRIMHWCQQRVSQNNKGLWRLNNGE
jgi:hypothetical protein